MSESSLQRDIPGPGQESVWDYPRPPVVQTEHRRVRVYVGGIPIVDSKSCLRVVETSHPPHFYVPNSQIRHSEVRRLKHQFVHDDIGTATLFTIIAGGRIAHRAAWSFLLPHSAYRRLAGHMGIYPGRVEACYLDDELVTPQEGDSFGGWITPDVVGPFKGPEGTEDW